MDYRTKAITREKIRYYSKIVRKIFKCRNKYFFDVVRALEILPIYFDNVDVEIVLDDDPDLKGAPSTIVPDMKGNYTIKIKQYVYDGAAEEKIGGYRNHIMHEISHYLLFTLGYMPHFDRVYNNKELKAYESIEWQAKALAGEVLISYENTIGLTEKQIETKCKVSKEAAHMRILLEK